jgi:hypothetical protein
MRLDGMVFSIQPHLISAAVALWAKRTSAIRPVTPAILRKLISFDGWGKPTISGSGTD